MLQESRVVSFGIVDSTKWLHLVELGCGRWQVDTIKTLNVKSHDGFRQRIGLLLGENHNIVI